MASSTKQEIDLLETFMENWTEWADKQEEKSNDDAQSMTSDDFAGAFGCISVALEVGLPVFTQPIQTFNAVEGNPKLIQQLKVRANELRDNVSALLTQVSHHGGTLTRQIETAEMQNTKHLQTILEQDIAKLEELQKIANKNDEDDEPQAILWATKIKSECEGVKADLDQLASQVQAVQGRISAVQMVAPVPRPLRTHASSIAEQYARTPVPFSVFISHAGEDKETMAIPLWGKLRARGISAFVDMKDLQVGQDAHVNMKQAMASAQVGVFILSEEFVIKKWPMLEAMTFQVRAEQARKMKKRGPSLIPLFYRLSIPECSDKGLMWRKNSEGRSISVVSGFSARVAAGETSVKEVMDSVKELTTRTGIENVVAATNENNEIMKGRREELLDQLVLEIQTELLSLSQAH